MSAELPKGWTLRRAAELFDFVTSGSRGWAQFYADRGPLFVRIGNLDHDTISLDLGDQQHVNPPTNSEGLRTRLQTGDILISITAELGMVGLVPDDLGEAYINQHIALARPASGHDNRFLAWFLAGPGKEQLLAMRRGMTKAGLGLEDIRSVMVPLPPLATQRSIVAEVESRRARSRRAREALDAVPPLLEKLRQSILAAAFRGDLTKDWRAKNKDVEPATELLKRIRIERRKKWEESELAKMKAKGKTPTDARWKAKYREPEPVDTEGLAELPEGWCWASVEEICAVESGFAFKSTDYSRAGVPLVRISNLDGHRVVFGGDEVRVAEVFVTTHARFVLRRGDVLMALSGATTGKMAVYDMDSVALLNQRVGRFVLHGEEHLAGGFAECVLRTVQARVVNDAYGGAQPNISPSQIEQMCVPFPPRDEQAAVVAKLDASSNAMRLVGATALTGQLDALDRATLAKAFRGQLVLHDVGADRRSPEPTGDPRAGRHSPAPGRPS